MTSNVVVVESPAKAKTIGNILARPVLASFGHVRDLPSAARAPDEDFAMDWEVDSRRRSGSTTSPRP